MLFVSLVRFCVVGASGYAVNLAVYSLLVLGLDMHYVPAAICSFLVAVNALLLKRTKLAGIRRYGAQ